MEKILVLLRLHISATVYWLGGERGVFQASYNVFNRELSIEERRRHVATAYRPNILARTSIILLLPLGLHMGHLNNLSPWGQPFLTFMWIFVAACLGMGLPIIMHRWKGRFRKLAEGSILAEEAGLERQIGYRRVLAYFCWILIAGICLLGIVKPI